jgi:hypothetical protein
LAILEALFFFSTVPSFSLRDLPPLSSLSEPSISTTASSSLVLLVALSVYFSSSTGFLTSSFAGLGSFFDFFSPFSVFDPALSFFSASLAAFASAFSLAFLAFSSAF